MDRNWVLNSNHQRLLKAVHLLLVASAFGGLISILSLLLLKQTGRFEGNTFPVDLGILKIFTWGVNYAFLILMITAFIYGIFTKWGFIKYKWIMLKWLLVLAMFIITWSGFGPAVNGMASISDAGLNNSIMRSEYLGFQNKALVFAAIEAIIMVIIIFISIFKPWGQREVKEQVRQKTIIMVILPLIIIGVGFMISNTISLNKIRNMPIGSVNLTKINDGVYKGEAKIGSYVYKVKVEVKNHRIIDIKGVENRKSVYVTYAEGVFQKIIREQMVDVDVVTGATTTSKAFMKAVENALKQ
ncbi:MAG: FMN-binding protein [Clostridiaceae bacterium]|nr:FMN-binding protein [Clostridiaceae bacterium]